MEYFAQQHHIAAFSPGYFHVLGYPPRRFEEVEEVEVVGPTDDDIEVIEQYFLLVIVEDHAFQIDEWEDEDDGDDDDFNDMPGLLPNWVAPPTIFHI